MPNCKPRTAAPRTAAAAARQHASPVCSAARQPPSSAARQPPSSAARQPPLLGSTPAPSARQHASQPTLLGRPKLRPAKLAPLEGRRRWQGASDPLG
eukprot:scaffold77516_cov51-Phaeocystis_antarctica.AAC.2